MFRERACVLSRAHTHTVTTNRRIYSNKCKSFVFKTFQLYKHWWCIIQFLLTCCWAYLLNPIFPIQTIFPLRTSFRLKRCLLTLFLLFCLNSSEKNSPTHTHTQTTEQSISVIEKYLKCIQNRNQNSLLVFFSTHLQST